MEYPKRLLGQFRNDYQLHGQFNLEIQVPHLEKLAGFYERRYKVTKHWTDCVKTHALYNSINRRQPRSLWEERAFGVQQEYWAYNSSFSLDQQRALTSNLKCELEVIRNQCRYDLVSLDEIAKRFDGADTTPNVSTIFFDRVSQISIDCSEKVANFAGRIIKESVQILRPGKPPCDFVALAIGSLARGEATPYSDLEFIFLVREKTSETTNYFERLAVTIYFLIANLGETKLSYMSIKELEGWFDDRAKNGFKIDGLTRRAGNIPTGNGSSHQQYHLIVSPEELAKRYHTTLDEPVRMEALRGDLTAMLKYAKPIFSHQAEDNDLFKILKVLIQSFPINSSRRKVNVEMLSTDVRKFNFKPSGDLLQKGFTADVKREIFRFPSILLLDINIVSHIDSTTSWKSLKLLHDKGCISAQLHIILRLLLAAATYMRLSAYLHHDSQDDRISVGQEKVANRQDSKIFLSHGRWFVPIELFIVMCTKMISLKRKLASSSRIMVDLRIFKVNDDDPWAYITTLFFTGRYIQTLALIKKVFGENICADPVAVTQNITQDQSRYETLDIVSETMFCCHEYKAALVLYQLIADEYLFDTRVRIADCYRELGKYHRAVNILETVTPKISEVCFTSGKAYFSIKSYKKSEESYLQALELDYSHMLSEQLFDYYGDPISTDERTEMSNMSFKDIESHQERLSMITCGSHNVIVYVTSLAAIYYELRQPEVSNSYYDKALHLISEVYGTGAAVPAAAASLNNQGHNFLLMGQGHKAVDHYKQAAAIYRKLPPGTSDCSLANTLSSLSETLTHISQFDEAKVYYAQALALCKALPGGARARIKGGVLFNLGRIAMAIGQYSQADKHFKEALVVFRKLAQGVYNTEIASILLNLGINCIKLGNFSESVDYSQQALQINRELAQGRPGTDVVGTISLGLSEGGMGKSQCKEAADRHKLDEVRGFSSTLNTSDKASVLYDLGTNYSDKGQYSKAAELYKDALAIYRESSYGVGDRNVAYTLRTLGCTYYQMNHFSDAEKSYKASLIEYREISHNAKTVDIAHILRFLGVTYSWMGQHTKAAYYYEQALAVSRELSHGASNDDIASTLYELGIHYIYGRKNHDKAIGTLRESVHMYIKIDPCNPQISFIWELLSNKLNHCHLI